MKLVRKCSDLQKGEIVVFMVHSDILGRKTPEDGNVMEVYPDSREVDVTYLEGYKQRWARVPFEDMLGVYHQGAPVMKFETISGPSDMLIPE